MFQEQTLGIKIIETIQQMRVTPTEYKRGYRRDKVDLGATTHSAVYSGDTRERYSETGGYPQKKRYRYREAKVCIHGTAKPEVEKQQKDERY